MNALWQEPDILELTCFLWHKNNNSFIYFLTLAKDRRLFKDTKNLTLNWNSTYTKITNLQSAWKNTCQLRELHIVMLIDQNINERD